MDSPVRISLGVESFPIETGVVYDTSIPSLSISSLKFIWVPRGHFVVSGRGGEG